MADNFPGAIYRLWEIQGDTTLETLIDKGLEQSLVKIVQKGSDVFSKMGTLGTVDHLEPKWAYEYQYPMTITGTMSNVAGSQAIITFSGSLFGDDIDSDKVQKVIRTDTILSKMSSGLPIQCKVTAVNGLVASVTAYSNTTLAVDSSAVTYDIVSSPFSDDRAADEPRALDRAYRFMATQKFSETFKITSDAKNQAYEVITDPVEHELTALNEKLRLEMARAIILGRPYHDGTAYRSGLYTKTPTLWGLHFWPTYVQTEVANTNIYTSLSGAQLKKSDLDKLAYYLMNDEGADFDRDKFSCIVHPSTRRYMQKFHISFRDMPYGNTQIGEEVDSIKLDTGHVVPIVADWHFPRTSVMLAPLAKCKWGWFKNDKPRRGKLPSDSIRYDKWQITFQIVGVKVENPRELGLIYYAKDFTG